MVQLVKWAHVRRHRCGRADRSRRSSRSTAPTSSDGRRSTRCSACRSWCSPGWAGQVSLGQIAFFAIGATVGAKATARLAPRPEPRASSSASSWAAWSRSLVGLPALRRRGFYLAVTTLAFSLATTSYFLNTRYFGWVPDGRIPRPAALRQASTSPRPPSIYYVVSPCSSACLFIVKGIRDSRTGRALHGAPRQRARGRGVRAARDAGPARRVRAVGRARGLAGCLCAHQQQGIDPDPLAPFQNLLIFTYVIIGGVTDAARGDHRRGVLDRPRQPAARQLADPRERPRRADRAARSSRAASAACSTACATAGSRRVARRHDIEAPGLATTVPEAPLAARRHRRGA